MSSSSSSDSEECPVCLAGEFTQLIQLSACTHKVCVGCLRYVINEKKSLLCPLCRTPFSSSVIDDYRIPKKKEPESTVMWFYRGKNYGKWRYTPDLENLFEKEFKHDPNGKVRFDIGPDTFEIDFSSMKQINVKNRYYRQVERSQSGDDSAKGIAGARYATSS